MKHGESGFVVDPDPAELAHAMSALIADRQLAREMGEAARQSAPGQSWEPIVERLLAAAQEEPQAAEIVEPESAGLSPLVQTAQEPVRVLVTDNQVLEPAVGGARVRVKEICKELAEHFPTEYIGAYDWPGPPSTDEWPKPTWHSRVLGALVQAIQTCGVVAEVRSRRLGHRCQLSVDDSPVGRVRSNVCTRASSNQTSSYSRIPGSIRWRNIC